jgi:hypothetical protein
LTNDKDFDAAIKARKVNPDLTGTSDGFGSGSDRAMFDQNLPKNALAV